MVQKVENLVRSAVTLLTALSVAVASVASALTDLSPAVTQSVASLVAVWAIVRRVSPVPKDQRGLS